MPPPDISYTARFTRPYRAGWALRDRVNYDGVPARGGDADRYWFSFLACFHPSSRHAQGRHRPEWHRLRARLHHFRFGNAVLNGLFGVGIQLQYGQLNGVRYSQGDEGFLPGEARRLSKKPR